LKSGIKGLKNPLQHGNPIVTLSLANAKALVSGPYEILATIGRWDGGFG